MLAVKNVYARLITKNMNNADELDKIKGKIGVSFAIGMLTEDEQNELMAMLPKIEQDIK